MGDKQPLISIIIPTYNRANLLGETLESILAQTYTNWECIVVDDGSIDDTAQLLEVYCNKDLRFHYYNRPKDRLPGGNAARNFGFEKSQGDYVNWFDSDDLMHPEKLEQDIKHITSGDYDFTISQTQFFNEEHALLNKYWNTSLWSNNATNDFITKTIGWSTNSPLWKKKSLLKAKVVFNETLKSGQDYLYHIQILSKGLKPVVCEKTLVHQRVHESKIEFTVNKANNKAIIYSYLLNHVKAFDIDEKTFQFIIKKSLQALCGLYKAKAFKKGVVFSCQVIKQPIKLTYKLQILNLICIGFIYSVFSVGYNYITIK